MQDRAAQRVVDLALQIAAGIDHDFGLDYLCCDFQNGSLQFYARREYWLHVLVRKCNGVRQ
jgi:hypothetical protein